MKKDLIFATSNSNKFQSVKKYIEKLDKSINLIQENIEILEPQSLDIKDIAIFKAKYAWEKIKKPLIIDDGGIFIEKYNKFPGALSKWVFKGIGAEGIWALSKDDPRAHFETVIAYIDSSENFKLFNGTTKGKIIKKEGKIKDLIMPFTEIFVPDGYDKVYSELTENKEDNYNHRYKATEKLINWLNSK